MVRLVLWQGDLTRFQDDQWEAMQWQHLDADDIIYIVTARGQEHRIKAAQISLERISPILPLQE